jgi:hypothetical protein
MFQLSPALIDSENSNLIDTKLNKKPSSMANKTLKKKNVAFDDTSNSNSTSNSNGDNNDGIKNKITSLGSLMSKIHTNSQEEDTYSSTNYQANVIDESISNSLTDSLNNELAKIQKMRETGNNLPQNKFLDNLNNPTNPINYDNVTNPIYPNNSLGLNNSNRDNNVLGNYNSSKSSLSNYNESYNTTSYNNESAANFDNNKLLTKLNYIIHLLEEQHNEKTNHITEELILYLFLGLFILFVLDSFARASKYQR